MDSQNYLNRRKTKHSKMYRAMCKIFVFGLKLFLYLIEVKNI